MTTLPRRVFLVAALAASVVRPARGQNAGLQTFEKGSLSIRTRTATHRFNVEIARQPRQHAQGLMYRRHLAADAGMLFLYSAARPASMWMKNTYIPLDMLYIDRNGRIVGFHERAVPGSLEVITSEEPVIAVLEVNGGTVARLGITVGDQVIHPAFQAGG